MHPEQAKKIKCDKCGAVIGLYRHDDGWRCGTCVWNERVDLVNHIEAILSAVDYTEGNGSAVVVSHESLDRLSAAVNAAK